jgi:hypothetical protein
MSAHLHNRLRLLLWVLLLSFGVDQGVALAQEIRHEGKTGHALVRHSGARHAASRLLADLPGGIVALPATAVELPLPDAWTRVSTPSERRPVRPRSVSLRSGYPRGPPA